MLYYSHLYHHIVMGSPSGSLNWDDIKGVLKVVGWVAISGAVTAVLDWLPNIDFGNYAPIAMGVINVLGVLAVKYGLDTRK